MGRNTRCTFLSTGFHSCRRQKLFVRSDMVRQRNRIKFPRRTNSYSRANFFRRIEAYRTDLCNKPEVLLCLDYQRLRCRSTDLRSKTQHHRLGQDRILIDHCRQSWDKKRVGEMAEEVMAEVKAEVKLEAGSEAVVMEAVMVVAMEAVMAAVMAVVKAEAMAAVTDSRRS